MVPISRAYEHNKIVGADFGKRMRTGTFQFSESGSSLAWASSLNSLFCRNPYQTLIHWMPPPFALKTPFCSLQCASSHPLPKNRLLNKCLSANRGLPPPLGAGSARPNPKVGVPETENPLCIGLQRSEGDWDHGFRPWSRKGADHGVRVDPILLNLRRKIYTNKFASSSSSHCTVEALLELFRAIVP